MRKYELSMSFKYCVGNFKLLRIAALINAICETKRVRLINGYFIGKTIKNVGKTPLCSKILEGQFSFDPNRGLMGG